MFYFLFQVNFVFNKASQCYIDMLIGINSLE